RRRSRRLPLLPAPDHADAGDAHLVPGDDARLNGPGGRSAAEAAPAETPTAMMATAMPATATATAAPTTRAIVAPGMRIELGQFATGQPAVAIGIEHAEAFGRGLRELLLRDAAVEIGVSRHHRLRHVEKAVSPRAEPRRIRGWCNGAVVIGLGERDI